MTTKEALYRELKYGLAATGGTLHGLIAQDHIKLDVRINPDSQQSDADYPWLIFRRVTDWEDNQVRLTRERYEIELIGKIPSAEKGDDLLESMKSAIVDHFSGKMKTWGQFDDEGGADPSAGLKLKAVYLDTADLADMESGEKVQILMFSFTHVRE